MGKWLSGATELTTAHSAKLQMFDTQLHNTHAYPGNITSCKVLLCENMQKVKCYIPVL